MSTLVRKTKAELLEEKFYSALRDVFIGAKVEGESGYINLMRVKSRYFVEGIFPQLKEDITSELAAFPDFKAELFDKLYTFFHRYFSESGSIYFRHTPLHQNIYERVYTNERDVMLFWKTHMLYYVKTDRLFRSLTVEPEEEGQLRFFFDASTLQNKKNNEKRELVYDFRERREADGTLVFTVSYSEKGRKTKTDEIIRQLKVKAGVKATADELGRAFRLFERQSEVDYFINRDARQFLEEQFRLWLYQYVFRGENVWTERRIAELQALQRVALKIIDFIAQFENELVKIWNKPKFARRSNYVITLDKIVEGDEALARRLLKHEGMKGQTAEWRDLNIVGVEFEAANVWKKDLTGERLDERYRCLPVDTRHFKELEPEILALFDDLDAALDGWLIKSENYQALNTMLPKLRERVKCIHIDPPYNTATSGFEYENTYKHSSWLSMMENRIEKSLGFMSGDGSFLCHIDENEYERLQLLFEETPLPNAGTIIWDKKNPMLGRKGVATQHEYIIWRTVDENPIYLSGANSKLIIDAAASIIAKNGGVNDKARKEFSSWIAGQENLSGGEKAYKFLDDDGEVYRGVAMGAPEQRTDPKFFIPLIHPVTKKNCPVPATGWSRTPDKIQDLIKKGEILFGKDETTQPQRKVFLKKDYQRQLSSVIQEAKRGKTDLIALGLEFPYGHPVSLYETLLGASLSEEDDLALDFFAGSGTTAHAVINLNREDGVRRKYVLVEANEYFHTVILPRVKKVVFADKWKDGNPAAGSTGISHFCKYYELEQYEETLQRVKYEDSTFFDNPYEDPFHSYVFLRDVKLLDAVEVDTARESVKVDFARLYPDIDAAETLSNLLGKPIRRLAPGTVEFDDGEKLDLNNLDFRTVKPLIWWQ